MTEKNPFVESIILYGCFLSRPWYHRYESYIGVAGECWPIPIGIQWTSDLEVVLGWLEKGWPPGKFKVRKRATQTISSLLAIEYCHHLARFFQLSHVRVPNQSLDPKTIIVSSRLVARGCEPSVSHQVEMASKSPYFQYFPGGFAMADEYRWIMMNYQKYRH